MLRIICLSVFITLFVVLLYICVVQFQKVMHLEEKVELLQGIVNILNEGEIK